MNYIKQQRKWVRACKLKKGDEVLIVDRFDDNPCGASMSFAASMPQTIGLTGKVTAIAWEDRYNGILVEGADFSWWYPFFVLVKVEDDND